MITLTEKTKNAASHFIAESGLPPIAVWIGVTIAVT